MPGVIMENGNRNGSYTNHDREIRPNGVNGGAHGLEKSQDRGKGREPQQNVTPTSPFAPNGLNGDFNIHAPRLDSGDKLAAGTFHKDMYALPPEIQHITQGYIELKSMLSRLAERTHKNMLDNISELAQLTLPASTTNGNVSHSSSHEDNSAENIHKKVHLLKFLENAHDSWLKALIITGWSRRAEEVSKIIDLHVHLNNIKSIYVNVLGQMGNDKQELSAARLLNPDLRTALEVLTTGKASWMPDPLGYIEPPPLTAKEILKSLEKLNTLLSIRLNLSDYSAIPIHFKDYTIDSGRATFKVLGEFEVDLTIAEESPEAQFWFIDFRFLFKPAVTTFSAQVRSHIENKVNEVLSKDGLSGCYKYLHEFVLTHKINEYRKQGHDLLRGTWTETLVVEPLNRSLCIQYWVNKHGLPSLAKSWFIMGVGSPKRKTAGPRSRATSHLFLRWFREGKEVENFNLPFDSVNISTESLLKCVIAHHIAHILQSMHKKLQDAPLFSKRELGISCSISLSNPAESYLDIQLTNQRKIRVQIEPITGRLILSPASPTITRWEHRLNLQCKDLAGSAHTFIEQLRYALVDEAITSHAMTVGWVRVNSPLLYKQSLKDGLQKAYATWLPPDHSTVLWFTRRRWSKEWHLCVFPSMSGEHWLLLRMASPSNQDIPNQRTGNNARNTKRVDPKIINYIQLPITTASPDPSYGFMSGLHMFAAGVISHHANLQVLHSRRYPYIARKSESSRAVTLPAIYFRMQNPTPKTSNTARANSAKLMKLTFHGIEAAPQNMNVIENGSTPSSHVQASQLSAPEPKIQSQQDQEISSVMEAQIILPAAKDLQNLSGTVDRDIAFNPKLGTFAIRVRSNVGESVIDRLVDVVIRVERLVDFVTVIRDHSKTLKLESTLLGKITFTYGVMPSTADEIIMDVDNQTHLYRATIDITVKENSITLTLEKGNPHLRIIDYLTSVLNSSQGLNGVASLLSNTLPINRGLDAIMRNWPLTEGLADNEMFVNVRAADWYTIRYNIHRLSPNSTIPPAMQRVLFSIRLRQRHGTPWWFIQRIGSVVGEGKTETDTIDEVLRSLWSSSGNGWTGMKDSAVGSILGIEELLGKLDETMRNFAMTEETSRTQPAASVQQTAPVQAAKPNPAHFSRQQQQMQQHRQQHTPNQSQSQGRSQTVKPEVVEID